MEKKLNREPPKIEKREAIDSASLVQIERDPNSLFTRISGELVNILEIPAGAFSGLATYREGGRQERISPTLDRLIAEHFTNTRHIIDWINNVGPISTKDPREKYEGEIDVVIEQTIKDLDHFQYQVLQELKDLEIKQLNGKISGRGYEKAKQVLENAIEIYKILLQELKLKKRGFDFLGKKEIIGDNISYKDLIKTNTTLEVKYLPGGGFVILRGYIHDSVWQSNFGDNREQEIGLANIYKNTRYISTEGGVNKKLGKSIQCRWTDSFKEHYDRLMREFVKNGFKGEFLEIDSRFEGEIGEKTFDKKNLTLKEAEVLFTYLKKYNLQLAKDIGSVENYIEIYHKQRLDGFLDSLEKREKRGGLVQIRGGTRYHKSASVKRGKEITLLTSSTLTGFELGQMVFSDALSVIKILLMNKAIQDGKLERGIIVDFQGVDHTSYKSYFFDNSSYAMEVVLSNLHEVLASHPDVQNREDILNKLQNLDKETWEWVFEFIGTIPLFKVAKATKDRDSVERGYKQRLMIRKKAYCATENLSRGNRKKLNKVIENLL